MLNLKEQNNKLFSVDDYDEDDISFKSKIIKALEGLYTDDDLKKIKMQYENNKWRATKWLLDLTTDIPW